MKHYFFILGLMLAMLPCTLAQGKNRIVVEKDSSGNRKAVIEVNDTVISGKAVTDTFSITTYTESLSTYDDDEDEEQTFPHHDRRSSFFSGIEPGHNAMATIISVTAIVFAFGTPAVVLLFIFYFRYKNRKAKYRLAEQALANGQPLPENFFSQNETSDIRSKGIKNIFVGIGLFVFLWSLTDEFGLGCIGLLVMFTGFGQLVIYYTQEKKRGDSDSHQ